jgi:hypothetical protein
MEKAVDGKNETRPETEQTTHHHQEKAAMAKATRLILVAFALLGTSGGSTAEAIDTTVITLPSVPTDVTTTEVINEIEVGMWYVIRSTVPLFILDAPQGSVSIVSGPSTVDGVFAGGQGVPETKVFAGPEHTYLVQGLRPCKAELILIPQGVTDRLAIERHMLTVTGEAPQPPPEPGPEPPPEPGPEPPPEPPPEPETVESFRVIFVKESGATLNSDQTAIPAAKVIRDYLSAKATLDDGIPGWREYDPDRGLDTPEEATMSSLWAAVKDKLLPAPCLVIEVNGHATVMPFPANVEECMETLRKFGGDE